MKHNRNLLMIQEVAKGLGELRTDVVFVGGATTAIYIDDQAAPEPTPSDDVDFVVEIGSHQEYAKLEKTLRSKGFKDPTPDPDVVSPICRKFYGNIQVDVMPTDPKILGFSNRWYKEAINRKIEVALPDSSKIFVFNAVYFLATKFEAFIARGKPHDIRDSTDLEDIISILDGCSTIEADLKHSAKEVVNFIKRELKDLLRDEALLEEAAHGFIRRSSTPELRSKKVIDRIRKIIADP